MKYQNIQEEEIKNKIAKDYFEVYNCTKIIGDIDFCVAMLEESREDVEQESLLWAEAKKGSSDIYKSITQLILTIGKARTFDKFLPPNMLAAFDGEKMAFVPYNEMQDIFYINDFNWNVAPSNHNSREFKLIHEKVKSIIDNQALLFYYENDDKELKNFIKNNFVVGKFGLTKTKIDKNNFITIYNKWLQTVKPSIAVNWDIAKKNGIIDGDFYLADLLSSDNESLKDNLYVLLKKNHYELDRKVDEAGMFGSKKTEFKDKQIAHTQFWNKYERPPKKEYWDYIIGRRDLLVPQDVRERKGSFFTPQIWVELSQKYLSDTLGVNWQDQYYIWDCAAGTGNLLAGLTNKFNIYASTLDKQDVDVMYDRIKNGANLVEKNVFQFDFLNDDFKKLPKSLQDIINDPEKRKKLLIYINPPYAEASNARTVSGTGGNRDKTTTENKIYSKYRTKIGKASNELFTQFLIRIYYEIPECKIANFSTLKNLQSANFSDFRKVYKAKLKKIFIVPADTFDNVRGKFPIGFFIWDASIEDKFERIIADVYNSNASKNNQKTIYCYDNHKYINNWIKPTQKIQFNSRIGFLLRTHNDFQNANLMEIAILPRTQSSGYVDVGHGVWITDVNFLLTSIYFAVRKSIEATWLNDRDQFLYPKNSWEKDKEFQNNCLAFTLFHGQNRITSKDGTNHWIPFTEYEVDAKERFESDFMAKFIAGKLKNDENKSLIKTKKATRNIPLVFSKEAKEVFKAGLELWKYYHSQTFPAYEIETYNANASLYDIREYFQGRSESGKMNHKAKDETYTKLIGDLREKLKLLGDKIATKVYEHGFLLK